MTEPAAAGRARARSERTRSAILETALRLFAERGYDKTTMRAIAAEAGVSVGNAYYYFTSKDHLIQGFYSRMVAEHVVLTRERMAGQTDLAARVGIALACWLEVAEPYHRFAGQFFRNAADPASPLSPFSHESAPARLEDTALYREVLAGTGLKVSPEIADILPEMLWLHQMAVVLYWVYDRSPGQHRTRELAARTAPMVARIVTLSRYKVLRPLVRQAESLVRDFLIVDEEEAPGRDAV
ncbi:TetR family transcriptional regulator [Phytomonospora sp. NPDC050363]|uniref:TetR/AcrR family transcriptional regulator n=1 Tax=Phytomonospora sp. NPDC050363 TaxID=3155642 RepID=UPI0033D6C591